VPGDVCVERVLIIQINLTFPTIFPVKVVYVLYKCAYYNRIFMVLEVVCNILVLYNFLGMLLRLPDWVLSHWDPSTVFIYEERSQWDYKPGLDDQLASVRALMLLVGSSGLYTMCGVGW